MLSKVTSAIKSSIRKGWHALMSVKSAGEARIAAIVGGSGGWMSPGGWHLKKLEQVQHFRLWTYIAIRAIAEEVAMRPPRVGRILRPGDKEYETSKRMLSGVYRKKALVNLPEHEQIEAVDSDDELNRLLSNPNAPDVSWTFWYRTMVFLELTAECYWWKVRNSFNRTVELWPLFPHWVTPVPGRERLVSHYEVRPAGLGNTGIGVEVLPAEDVVPFVYPSSLSMINGWGPLAAGGEWVDTAEAIDAAKWFMFENGINPGLVINLDKEVFPEPPSKPQLDRLYEQINERGLGREKFRRLLVLNPGMKGEPWNTKPLEMDFQNSSDQQRDMVLALHRVTKSIVGIKEDINRASAFQATADFLNRTIGPKLTFIGQVATENVAREFDERAIVYWPGMPDEDPEMMNANIETDAKCLAITPNEIRKLRGRDPYKKGGNNPILPSGMELPLNEDLLDDDMPPRKGDVGENDDDDPDAGVKV